MPQHTENARNLTEAKREDWRDEMEAARMNIREPMSSEELAELAQIRAELIVDQPEAVNAAVDNKAEEFLRACVKFARTASLHEDPFASIRVLTEALIWLRESQGRMEKEVAAQGKPKQTSTAFKR